MRYPVLFLSLLLSIKSYTQTPVDALVNAERSFAALAAKTTTRKAFLQFLDSNSIVFSQGQILNGYTRWSRDIPDDSSLLLWRPEFAVLSASGDFGCTMGPSEYRTDRSAGATGHFGYFASLWHRSKAGRWTVLCDIGVPQADPPAEDSRPARKVLANTRGMSGDTSGAVAKEKEFLDAFKAGQSDLLKAYSAPDAWVLLAGRQPVRSRQMDDFDAALPGHYAFEPAGHWFSPAGDMLVSYGRTTADQKKANYMWVWVADRGRWELALMVMN